MMIRTFKYVWMPLWRTHPRKKERSHLLHIEFNSRRECREYIKEHYGYIATRKDLRTYPHDWRMPIPIKVKRIYECEVPL